MISVHRYSHAPDGVHAERLSCNSGHLRARVSAPMTLLPVLMHEQSQQLHAARTGEKPSDPPVRKTPLDKALDDDATGSKRWALSRYICDMLAVHESPGANGGGVHYCGSALPFSEAKREALGRVAFVHARVTRAIRADLEQFAVNMGARHSVLEPVSLADFSGRKGSRRGREYLAIQRILELAGELYSLYLRHARN